MAVREKKLLKIGEVAIQSGVLIKTIRYYEQIGLWRSIIPHENAVTFISPSSPIENFVHRTDSGYGYS